MEATAAGLVGPEARCPLTPLNGVCSGQRARLARVGNGAQQGQELHCPPQAARGAQPQSQVLSTWKASLREVPEEKPRAPFPGEGVPLSQTEAGRLGRGCWGQQSVTGIGTPTGGHAVFRKCWVLGECRVQRGRRARACGVPG